MNRQFKTFVLKITIVTSCILLIFNASLGLLSAFSLTKDDTKSVEKNNDNTFQNTSNPVLGKTGVALNVNLGTKFTQINELPANIYVDAINIGQLMQGGTLSTLDGGIISTNMTLIQEYKNVLKTDFKSLINKSNDREAMLSSIISQLTYRYNLGVEQVRSLSNQGTVFQNDMTKSDNSINALKTKISSDFSKNDAAATYKNLENYLALKKEYEYARTYIIYIDQFLSDYTILSNYTKNLLDTLVNNKDAIIKNSYVVIPDSGVELLREFDLLYNSQAPNTGN